MIGYIYCFTNKINNKKYIGSTIKSPNERYNEHISSSRSVNAHSYNYPLQSAIRKYGIENFNFSIIETVDYGEDVSKLREKEHNYIISFETLCPNGYNQTLNTDHPWNDPVVYEKIRNTKREKSKKVALVDENNNIIQTWRSIVDCAEDIKEDEKKIASCCRGERHTTNGKIFYWLDNNDELIIPNYTGLIYKGEVGTTQKQVSNKKVIKLDKEDNIIDIYESIALAARENNCDASGISKVCRGKRNLCGGFKWKYDE